MIHRLQYSMQEQVMLSCKGYRALRPIRNQRHSVYRPPRPADTCQQHPAVWTQDIKTRDGTKEHAVGVPPALNESRKSAKGCWRTLPWVPAEPAVLLLQAYCPGAY